MPEQKKDARQALIQSQEFATTSPQGRKAMLQIFKDSSPEDQQRMVFGDQETEGLTPIPVPETPGSTFGEFVKQTGKEIAATGVDIAGATLGGMAGSTIGMPFIGSTAGAVGADRLNRAVGLRNPNTVSLPLIGDIPNKEVIGPITAGDIMAAAPQVLAGPMAAAGRFMAKPAVKATLEKQVERTTAENIAQKTMAGELSDTAERNATALAKHGENVSKINAQNAAEAGQTRMQNMGAQEQYARQMNKAALDTQASITSADREAADAVAAWKAKGQTLDREFLADKDQIIKSVDLSNEAKAKQLVARQKEWQSLKKEHQSAYTDLPKAGTAEIGFGDFEAGYAKAKELGAQAEPVDITGFHTAAKEHGVELGKAAPGVQSNFKRVAEALSGFGVVKGTEDQVPTILGPTGAPMNPSKTAAALESVPLPEVMATQRQLGKLVGRLSTAGGEEYGVAKDLYANLADDLKAHAAKDPVAAEAIGHQMQANRDFMRSRIVDDYDKLWRKNSKLIEGNTYAVNKDGLRNGFDAFKDDRFVKMGLDPKEIDSMKQAIDQAPTKTIGPEPVASPVRTPDAILARREYTYNKAQARLDENKPSGTPDYSGVKFPGVEPPETSLPNIKPTPSAPAPQQPDYSKSAVKWPGQPTVGPLPVSPMILSKAALGAAVTAGGAFGLGLGGPVGAALGLGAAAGGIAIPHYVSQALLNNTGLVNSVLKKMGMSGESIIQNIINKDRKVTPRVVAVLTGLARSLGANRDEGNGR